MSDESKASLWEQRLQTWEHSGLSPRVFCQHKGYTLGTFYYWRRKLRNKQHQVANARQPQRAFLPLVGTPETDEPESGQRMIEIALPHGIVIRVPADAG